MNSVFIDTNILYNILFETSLTRKARRLLEEYEENKFHTSLTVVNELLYISARKYYQTLGELKSSYSFRKLIARKGYPEFIANGIRRLLEDLEVEVLVENVKYQEMIEVASQLKLLPSDAIIALTCKHNNIDTIITFDEDFKRVPWLKVVS
ncbi:MAG: PIN domain-containing protein [Desulfurococcales archaeon]|nr:PIN domain-containing protein [Desulfurococcales archaeon]